MTVATAAAIPHVAEDVLPGHPDRLADAVAEGLVDLAVSHDPDALVGVEVAVHRRSVFVTGRIAAGAAGRCVEVDLECLVRTAFETAGYAGPWRLPVRVEADTDIGPLDDEERAIRGFSDDQNIVVGHASATPATGLIPPGAFVARGICRALERARDAAPDLLGPDGKVLVRLRQTGERFRWERCNLSILHASGAGYPQLYRHLLPGLEEEVRRLDAVLPGLAESWRPEEVRLNGCGDFTCGGPQGDNGLSGKKLVVDHYGPGAPIGGGALCGKDPHKVDRAGALRARQLAVRLLRASSAKESTVRLGFLPGLESPDFLEAQVDGEWWDEARVRSAIHVPDLSLEGTFRELELDRVRWQDVARRGYFGTGMQWDR